MNSLIYTVESTLMNPSKVLRTLDKPSSEAWAITAVVAAMSPVTFAGPAAVLQNKTLIRIQLLITIQNRLPRKAEIPDALRM